MLLWDQSFDHSQTVKNYKLKHSTFYKLLFKGDEENQESFARANVAFLINQICNLLKAITDIGAMHGNMRTENIVLTLNKTQKQIKKVGFLGFGQLINIEESENICIPDRIDHLPPDMTSYLLKLKRFSSDQGDQKFALLTPNEDVNVRFLQASASADIFSLGVVLLEIATGIPCQVEMPIKLRCVTVNNSFY